ncbi:hypothetical protein [Delftia acidovorans]|uniref:hypothetical protein n=1 Tax=Delftia acidovorans TaxID=80866 RepID=UPI001EDEC6AC|nr:hypothetical protein [Delftia acidovorans]MCG3785751.1 hypothetical protein [Delftia acidovorans]
MRIDPVYVQKSINSAKELAQQYKLRFVGHDEPQKHIDWLIELYTVYMKRPAPVILEATDVPYEKSPVYSMAVLKENQNLDIVLASGLNHCWLRFAIAKEVFHAILDADEFHMSIPSLLESVLIEFPSEDATASPGTIAEFITEVGTMEFCFPYKARLAELRVQNPDYHAIAQRYRVPRVKVERYLTPEYMRQLASFEG